MLFCDTQVNLMSFTPVGKGRPSLSRYARNSRLLDNLQNSYTEFYKTAKKKIIRWYYVTDRRTDGRTDVVLA